MNRNLGLLALTGILTLASCGQNNDDPKCSTNQTLQNGKCVDNSTNTGGNTGTTTPSVVNHTLNVVLNGDVKDGTFSVQTPSGDTKTVVVSNGAGSISVPNTGKYTVTAANITGYTVSPSALTADLTSSDQTVTFTSTKNAVAPTTPSTGDQGTGTNTGTVFGHFHVDAGQQMQYVSDKSSDDYNTYQPQSVTGAWRAMSQTATNGEVNTPAGYTDLYVKGKVNFTLDVTSGKRVEVLLARTTGRDVPTVTETQAADVLLNTTADSGTTSFTLDSTRLGEYEGVREWLVLRIDGTQLYYQPIIADNSAPTQPEPAFAGITNTYSSTYNNWWARGDVRLYTTNSDIVDKPDQAAPKDSSFANRHPSGFDGIRYYMVPEAMIASNPTVATSNLVERAAALKALAAASSDVIKTQYITTKGDATFPFASDVGSGSVSKLTKQAKDGVQYRIYAVSRDQLGNEAASATYKSIAFDNVGPTIACSVIKDASPLPFSSINPVKYVSGLAQLDMGTVTDDKGVGVNPTTYNISLGGKQIPVTKTEAMDAKSAQIDEANANLKKLTQHLKDLQATLATATDSTVINNTKAEIAKTNNDIDTVNIQIANLNKDLVALKGAANTFDSRIFADGEYPIQYSSMTDFLGNPVQASKDCGTVIIDNTAPVVGFNRPSMSAAQTFNSGETVTLESTSSDAGAGLYRTLLFWDDSSDNVSSDGTYRGLGIVGAPAEIVSSAQHKDGDFVTNETTNGSWVGLSNGGKGTVNYVKLKALVIDRAGNATVISNPIKVVSTGNTATAGTFTAQAGQLTVSNVVINTNAMLNSVDAYGVFNSTDWNSIRAAAVSDIANRQQYGNGAVGATVASANTTEWNSMKTPLLGLGNLAKANNTTGIFSYTDDNYNKLYWGRGFDNSGYSYLPGNLNAKYGGYNVVITDSTGAYSKR